VGVGRGIVVASVNTPWGHGNGRIRFRSAPAELLADLRDRAGIPLGPISESTLDGHPALVEDVRYPGANDLHYRSRMDGLAGEDYIDLTLASRLIVVDVDGLTMLIDVWARIPDDSRHGYRQPTSSSARSISSRRTRRLKACSPDRAYRKLIGSAGIGARLARQRVQIRVTTSGTHHRRKYSRQPRQ
jgi:hypothetical protein